jgi:NAD-dependent dihydropyrimidine dehydrogenase PreA subunit
MTLPSLKTGEKGHVPLNRHLVIQKENRPVPVSRRRFLQGLGAAAAVTAAGGLGIAGKSLSAAGKPTRKPKPKRQWAMVIDLRRCDGCKECTGACQNTHFLPNDHEWIKVYEIDSEHGGRFHAAAVHAVRTRPCLVCPVGPRSG